MSKLLFIEPIFHEKIWGGRRLETEFGYDIPDGKIGECWAISAHPNGDCVVKGGEYDGRRLSELWRDERSLFGGEGPDEFPLLVKIIDADDDLSIQVHPEDAYAAEHENGSLGKRECWYVLDAEPGATIVVGQKAAGRDEFAAKVEAGEWGALLNELPVEKGDFFQIDPGCVHAIKGGTMILETQQSSDITYRVYDYDRLGDDGKPRDLHLDKSMDVIDYDREAPACAAPVPADPSGITLLERNGDYTVYKLDVDGSLKFENDKPYLLVSVIDGEGAVNGEKVARGDHFIVPAGFGDLALEGAMSLIVSHE
jgi:mannose-6-phosphate isomerase